MHRNNKGCLCALALLAAAALAAPKEAWAELGTDVQFLPVAEGEAGPDSVYVPDLPAFVLVCSRDGGGAVWLSPSLEEGERKAARAVAQEAFERSAGGRGRLGEFSSSAYSFPGADCRVSVEGSFARVAFSDISQVSCVGHLPFWGGGEKGEWGEGEKGEAEIAFFASGAGLGGCPPFELRMVSEGASPEEPIDAQKPSSDGSVLFGGLAAGVYSVSQSPAQGYSPLPPFYAKASRSGPADFYEDKELTKRMPGYIDLGSGASFLLAAYSDRNGDGVCGKGEPAAEGVPIALYRKGEDGAYIPLGEKAVTSKSGLAFFPSLESGSYRAAIFGSAYKPVNFPKGIYFVVSGERKILYGDSERRARSEGIPALAVRKAQAASAASPKPPSPSPCSLTVSLKGKGPAPLQGKFLFRCVFENGIGAEEFFLSEGESRTISAIPYGTEYEVAVDAPGYDSEIPSPSGVLRGDRELSVSLEPSEGSPFKPPAVIDEGGSAGSDGGGLNALEERGGAFVLLGGFAAVFLGAAVFALRMRKRGASGG
jgi:hypothetical protein